MILFFFQNCLSPHQIPYIRECAKDERVEKVYFVMPRVDYNERSDMGWNNDRLLNEATIEFVLKPTDEKVKEILGLRDKDIRCLFSGIRGDADVFRWLNISIGFEVKRYIITEPPFTFNKPLWMHYVRFFLQDYKFVKHIDGIFAIGESCERYYKSISRRWKVFPFLYITESYDDIPAVNIEGDLKILYVGSLSKRKNVRVLVEALKGVPDVRLNVIGDGEERDSLEALERENGVKAKFFGTLPMKDIPLEMRKNDVLALPSLYDGWGAVVNEALTQGLYVVCSDKCGAKDLLHDKSRGLVFKNNDIEDLRASVTLCKKSLKDIRKNKKDRKEWANDNISGKVIAKYFIGSLSGDNVKCPWK